MLEIWAEMTAHVMTNQVNKDKIRKSSLDFKRGRTNSHRQNCSQTARKEAREGKTYETGIGLNLDLNLISTVTSSTLKEIIPEHTTRPLSKQFNNNNNIYSLTLKTSYRGSLCTSQVT